MKKGVLRNFTKFTEAECLLYLSVLVHQDVFFNQTYVLKTNTCLEEEVKRIKLFESHKGLSQKQPPEAFCKKRCSLKVLQISRGNTCVGVSFT